MAIINKSDELVIIVRCSVYQNVCGWFIIHTSCSFMLDDKYWWRYKPILLGRVSELIPYLEHILEDFSPDATVNGKFKKISRVIHSLGRYFIFMKCIWKCFKRICDFIESLCMILKYYVRRPTLKKVSSVENWLIWQRRTIINTGMQFTSGFWESGGRKLQTEEVSLFSNNALENLSTSNPSHKS